MSPRSARSLGSAQLPWLQMGLESATSDVWAALRAVRRSPGFAVAAIIVLSLGCAFTGTVFSIVNGWLSVRGAVPSADRLVYIAPTNKGNAIPLGYFKERAYRLLFDRRLGTVRSLFAAVPVPAVLSAGDASTGVRMEVIAGDYFQAIGVSPQLGRALDQDDDRVTANVPVVLGDGTWRRVFGSDVGVVGRSVRVSGVACTIVGVMPAEVRGFSAPTSNAVDIWAPASGVRSLVTHGGPDMWGQVFGRLSDGASLPQAQAEMQAVGVGVDPNEPGLGAAVLPVEQGIMSTRARVGLKMAGTGLVALSALVLLIACANLANLQLARTTSRSSEIAVRMALGAAPWRIVRQHLVESALISAAGAGTGFLLVKLAGHLLGWFTVYSDGGSGMTGRLVVDGWVVVYFIFLAALASASTSILQLVRLIRIDPAAVLTSSGVRGRTTGRMDRRRTILVASQVAASTVLLLMAALFVKSAFNATRYQVGFDTKNVAVGFFDFSPLAWDETRGRSEQEALVQLARATPGILEASVSTGLPAGGDGELLDVEPDDAGLGPASVGPPCRCLSVSPTFFGVLGLSPIQGRVFNVGDVAGGAVVVVNQAAATGFWPGRDAVGKRLRLRNGVRLDVVGVVPTSDLTALDQRDRCYVFVPMVQRYKAHFMLAVAGTAPATSLLRPLQKAVAVSAPAAAMFGVRTADERLGRAGAPMRSIALALVVLGAAGLVIAASGLYGIVTYMTGLRNGEFGIRKVLGATSLEIYRLVCWEAIKVLMIGLVIGIALAYVASPLVATMLIGTGPHDVATYASVTSCLIAVGLIAALPPAFRAVRVEPIAALRDL